VGFSRPFVVGVAGGTGSGKTTVAERLAGLVGPDRLSLLKLDAYYRDRASLPFEERVGIDYDHPDAFDWPLLLEHVRALCAGYAVDAPVYDFSLHIRSPEKNHVMPARIVVVEGILVLYEAELREIFDLRVFVDTDADVRLLRRIQRDVAERGRTIDSVMSQYLATVRPGHLQFVEPSKRYADVIVPHGGMNEPAVDVLLARVRELLRD
jgi:uridine kinase